MFICSTPSARKNDCTRTCQCKCKFTTEKVPNIKYVFINFEDENKTDFHIAIQSVPHREHSRLTLVYEERFFNVSQGKAVFT